MVYGRENVIDESSLIIFEDISAFSLYSLKKLNIKESKWSRTGTNKKMVILGPKSPIR